MLLFWNCNRVRRANHLNLNVSWLVHCQPQTHLWVHSKKYGVIHKSSVNLIRTFTALPICRAMFVNSWKPHRHRSFSSPLLTHCLMLAACFIHSLFATTSTFLSSSFSLSFSLSISLSLLLFVIIIMNIICYLSSPALQPGSRQVKSPDQLVLTSQVKQWLKRSSE